MLHDHAGIKPFAALAAEQIAYANHVSFELHTFSKWAMDQVGHKEILSAHDRRVIIGDLASALPLDVDFCVEEADYVAGLLLPDRIDDYPTLRREGRGHKPAMPQKLRERFLAEVIHPYARWKRDHDSSDWGDLAVSLLRQPPAKLYDVLMIDETQDFQANQVRAVLQRVAPLNSVTFVLDSAQRIYPHFFRWGDVDLVVQGKIHALSQNYRNTAQIAAFARPLVDGVEIGPEGSLPDLSACKSKGAPPTVLIGKFSNQARWAIDYIKRSIDLSSESVAFLHPAGGNWFREIRAQLGAAGLRYEDITREREWPGGDVNIVLSTMHSAKGLEFDHVVILGLNSEVMQRGAAEDSDNLDPTRRLLAMAVTRAKKSVIIGYKPGEASLLTQFFQPGTYGTVKV